MGVFDRIRRVLYREDEPFPLAEVAKLAGVQRPSQANQEVFERAVDEVALAASRLLDGLTTSAAPRNREIEAAKARERSAIRFRRPPSEGPA